HKIDGGGVRLGLGTAPEVAAAYTSMEASLGEAMGGAVVQTMADAGPEVIVGVVQDPSFGPLVMFGSGGTAVELLGDRVFRVLPLTDIDAYELVRATRGSPLLFGYRGAPPADVASLEDLVLRVGRLVDDIPEIAELDLNPVIASPAGAVAVDAKVRLAPWMPRRPSTSDEVTPWPQHWRGQWIWSPEPDTARPRPDAPVAHDVYLRVVIAVTEHPVSLPARATCDSRYVLYVNGVELGRGP